MELIGEYSSFSSSSASSDATSSGDEQPRQKRHRGNGAELGATSESKGNRDARSPYSPDTDPLNAKCNPPSGAWEPPPLCQKPGPKSQAAKTGNDHQGRIRRFPHVPGNFATHVYITVPIPQNAFPALEDIMHQMRSHIPDLRQVEAAQSSAGEGHKEKHTHGVKQDVLDTGVEYHLSLSRTVAVRYPQIETLVLGLRESLEGLKSFTMQLSELEVLVNDDETRTFLAISIVSPKKQVRDAISRVDRAFSAEGLQRFYAEPRPHVSFAWALGNQRDRFEAALSELSLEPSGGGDGLRTPSWEQEVRKIDCRAGCYVHNVWEAPS